jgi:hypothetical protein
MQWWRGLHKEEAGSISDYNRKYNPSPIKEKDCVN